MGVDFSLSIYFFGFASPPACSLFLVKKKTISTNEKVVSCYVAAGSFRDPVKGFACHARGEAKRANRNRALIIITISKLVIAARAQTRAQRTEEEYAGDKCTENIIKYLPDEQFSRGKYLDL